MNQCVLSLRVHIVVVFMKPNDVTPSQIVVLDSKWKFQNTGALILQTKDTSSKDNYPSDCKSRKFTVIVFIFSLFTLIIPGLWSVQLSKLRVFRQYTTLVIGSKMFFLLTPSLSNTLNKRVAIVHLYDKKRNFTKTDQEIKKLQNWTDLD